MAILKQQHPELYSWLRSLLVAICAVLIGVLILKLCDAGRSLYFLVAIVAALIGCAYDFKYHILPELLAEAKNEKTSDTDD